MRFPLFLELAGTSCLVVGAGEVALWKKGVLEEYGAQVELTTDFMPEQVEGRTLVVAATNDRSVNRQVYEACCARKIPVNVVDDPELNRTITVTTAGSDSAVIWNPWKERSAVLPDYTPDAYKTMVCVETCNALEDARTIQPGQSHAIKATYTVAQR